MAYEYHEVANIFPMMSDDEFSALVEDIRANGQRQPIYLHEGRIIDGRNRYRACQQLGIDPDTRVWDGVGSLVSFVVSLNLQRRHLTSSQKAIVAMDVLPMLEAEAKERQGARNDIPQLIGECSNEPRERHANEAVQQAAQMVGTNRQYVSDAKRLRDEAPELLERVRSGELTVPQAKRELREELNEREATERAQREAASAHHRVIPIIINGRAESCSEIEDKSVDLIITSPPYNLGVSHWPMGGGGNTPRESGIGYDVANDAMPEFEYQEWQISVLDEMWRVAKDGASFFYNHKVRQSNGGIIHPLEWITRSLWNVRQEIIWDRGSTHNHSASLFWPQDERIYWLTKGDPSIASRSVGIPSVWRIPFTNVEALNDWHPAPFPSIIPESLIRIFTSEDAVVLDPFMGSATTLIAATRLGRRSIGVELSIDYIKKVKEMNSWTIN